MNRIIISLILVLPITGLQNLYAGHAPGTQRDGKLDKGLVLSYDMDIGETSVIKDISTAGNDGTAYNGVVFANGVATFDGSDDYIKTPTTIAMGTDFTICMNLYRFAGGDGQYININNGDSVVIANDNSTGYVTAWIYDVSAGLKRVTVINSINHVSEWFFVTITYSSTTLDFKLYVNGELKDTDSTTGAFLDSVNKTADIGRHPADTAYIHSKMDNIKIYNRALSPSEIYELYTQGRHYHPAN